MAQMTDAQWREFVMAGTRTGKLAEEYGQRNGVPGELLVRIHISKVIAQREIASQPWSVRSASLDQGRSGSSARRGTVAA